MIILLDVILDFLISLLGKLSIGRQRALPVVLALVLVLVRIFGPCIIPTRAATNTSTTLHSTQPRTMVAAIPCASIAVSGWISRR
jgi:hypothetical protein